MLSQLSAFFACLSILAGAALLYAGLTTRDASQTVELMGGACLFALSLALFRPALKNWIAMRRYRRG
jgi:hypothetical protein